MKHFLHEVGLILSLGLALMVTVAFFTGCVHRQPIQTDAKEATPETQPKEVVTPCDMVATVAAADCLGYSSAAMEDVLLCTAVLQLAKLACEGGALEEFADTNPCQTEARVTGALTFVVCSNTPMLAGVFDCEARAVQSARSALVRCTGGNDL